VAFGRTHLLQLRRCVYFFALRESIRSVLFRGPAFVKLTAYDLTVDVVTGGHSVRCFFGLYDIYLFAAFHGLRCPSLDARDDLVLGFAGLRLLQCGLLSFVENHHAGG
jgi:hypothetical protein